MSDLSLIDPLDVDSRTIRRKRLVKAVMASTASKVLALIVQLLAFPFALHSLGTDRYASYLALQSFLSWTGLCGLGISMSLPKFIAGAHTSGDKCGERDLVLTAMFLLGCASLAVLLFLIVLGMFISPGAMVAASDLVPADELRIAYFLAAFLSAAQLFFSIESAIRSGYQELYRSSICAAIASVFFVLPGLVYVGGHHVSIATFILVLFLPLVTVFMGDLVILFFQRPYLRHGAVQMRETAKKLAVPSGNALAFQLEYALIVYLPTWIVAHLTTAGETAAFGSILQLMGLGAASLNLFFQPLMSAVANAHSHKDRSWIMRNYRRFFLLIAGTGVVIFLGAATMGPFVIRQWLGPSIQVSHTMLALFGLYFLFLSISLFQFYILSALGALGGTGKFYLLQGGVALGLGTILCLSYGAVGMVGGLAMGTAATSWILPLRVWREIKAV